MNVLNEGKLEDYLDQQQSINLESILLLPGDSYLEDLTSEKELFTMNF